MKGDCVPNDWELKTLSTFSKVQNLCEYIIPHTFIPFLNESSASVKENKGETCCYLQAWYLESYVDTYNLVLICPIVREQATWFFKVFPLKYVLHCKNMYRKVFFFYQGVTLSQDKNVLHLDFIKGVYFVIIVKFLKLT